MLDTDCEYKLQFNQNVLMFLSKPRNAFKYSIKPSRVDEIEMAAILEEMDVCGFKVSLMRLYITERHSIRSTDK